MSRTASTTDPGRGTRPRDARAGRSAGYLTAPSSAPVTEAAGASPALGVQFGAVTCRAVALVDGRLVVLRSDEGDETIPSVLCLDKSGELLVGIEAKRRVVSQADRIRWPLRIGIDPPDGAGLELDRYAPEVVTAVLIRRVVGHAEVALAGPATAMAVTVPVHLVGARRDLFRTALRVAELDDVPILDEPVAAAYAYGLERQAPHTVLVVDLGATSLDVTTLRAGDGDVSIVASHSDVHLGGDDWSERIVDWVTARVARRTGVDLSGDRMARQRMREAGDDAKHELTATLRAELNLPFLTTRPDKGTLHYEDSLDRTRFDAITSDLLRRCRDTITAAVSSAGGTVDQVLLIGGATRMPAIVTAVQQLTGREPLRGDTPERTAATGAATFAVRYADRRDTAD